MSKILKIFDLAEVSFKFLKGIDNSRYRKENIKFSKIN